MPSSFLTGRVEVVADVMVPQSLEQIEPLVREHLPRFGEVLTRAWDRYDLLREGHAAAMSQASASSRGMLVSDFTREPAHAVFGKVAGARVDDRFRRPWVNLDGGRVQVRFRKLTSSLLLCPSDSDRATALAYHLGDPAFPDMPVATVLTAGYVLDSAESALARLALVCHFGRPVHFAIPISLAGKESSRVMEPQLAAIPLSPPIIRSARDQVRKRLAGGDDE